MRVLQLSQIFSAPGSNTCVWLNGSPSAERPIWTRLWNGAVRRWATDGAANRLLMRSSELQYPQVVVGDMDSIKAATRSALVDTRFVETPDQDKTDLTKTLELIVQETQDPQLVVVLGGLSGRFDHSLATMNSLLNAGRLRPLPEIYAIDGENIVCVLQEGETSIPLERSLFTGKCGFVPFCQKTATVSTKGFKWNLDHNEMSFGGLISTSNELVDDVIWISTTAPLILTLELSDAVLDGW